MTTPHAIIRRRADARQAEQDTLERDVDRATEGGTRPLSLVDRTTRAHLVHRAVTENTDCLLDDIALGEWAICTEFQAVLRRALLEDDALSLGIYMQSQLQRLAEDAINDMRREIAADHDGG